MNLLRARVTRWSPASLLSAIGALAASLLVLQLLVSFVASSVRFEYFNPSGLVEEAAYTYISARNYQTYGFLNSGLLQDFSHSSNPADHPYVYNHMPPGPDLLTALLLELFRGSYRLCRLAFVGFFLIGLWFYFKFTGLILRTLGLTGASYTLLLIGPWYLMSNLDRQPYSPFLLLGFLPPWALQAYYRTERTRYLVLVIGVGLVSALYLEYVLLSAVVWCWILLWLTQVLRVDGRHAAAFVGVVAFGVILHLIQNLLYLGAGTFFQELRLLLMNRVAGVPSQAELTAFYRSVGLVHHGSHLVDPRVLLSQLALQFEFWGRGPVTLVGAACLYSLVPSIRLDGTAGAMTLFRGEATRTLGALARIWLWIGGTVLLPNLMFPAFNQEVTLRGSRANLYFLAIGAVATVGSGLRLVLQPRRSGWRFVAPAKTLGIATLAALASWSGALMERLEPAASSGGAEDLERAGRGCLQRARLALAATSIPWQYVLADATVCVAVLLGTWSAVSQVVGSNLDQLSAVKAAAQEGRFSGLGDLRAFAGKLFMTNINSPTVGFFVREAGYGVCGPEAIPEAGPVDVTGCKAALMRRHDLERPPPSYYFFFTYPDLFPGFSDCLPSVNLPSGIRGGDECVAATRRGLARRFAEVFDNGVFTAFDLNVPARSEFEQDPEIAPPFDVNAEPRLRSTMLLSWRDPYRKLRLRDETASATLPDEYRIERKRTPTEPFAEVGVTGVDETSYLVTGLEPGARHFFRVRSCRGNRCSAYVYGEGRTAY